MMKKKKLRERESGREKRSEDCCRCRMWIVACCLVALLILLCLVLMKSCGEAKDPLLDVDRFYEADVALLPSDIIPSAENQRVNLIISDEYRISSTRPCLYIRYPKQNIFDVVFTLKDADGSELYQTGYVAPGTTVGIDGTVFLEEGRHQLDCLVSVYDRESGELISDCTTIVFNVVYE